MFLIQLGTVFFVYTFTGTGSSGDHMSMYSYYVAFPYTHLFVFTAVLSLILAIISTLVARALRAENPWKDGDEDLSDKSSTDMKPVELTV